MTRLGVPRERTPGERRVALVPESVARLVKLGVAVVVERGAGESAYFADADYERAGATLGDAAAAWAADVVVKVRRPMADEDALAREGAVLVALLQPHQSPEALAALAARGVTLLALERVPRTTRAQYMDILSSQATVVGYKAVLLAAGALPKFLPMLTTAAGTIRPARTLVMGAGVAGLQAIATAKRLGAVVSAFDVRPAVKEQVESLGAKFVAADLATAEAEAAGGYAREQSREAQERTMEALRRHVREMDVVITTAQVPGKAAPRLISAQMVREMRPGSVIVDVAAESGGNCELTKPGETINVNGVRILGPLDLASSVPADASQMFSRNVANLVEHMLKDGQVRVDAADEIVGPMIVK